MAGSRLQLLEGFACESSGAVVEMPFGIQRLLAFLALRGSSHRCQVAGSLWPDVPEAHALASLRSCVWRVNKLVPELLKTDGAALSMSDAMTVDSREQEAFATSVLRDHVDDQAWIHAGLRSLWPGELLPGWYDDWVIFERERLSQLRLHALERSARMLLERDDLDTALQLALEAVRAERLRESANAVLMKVYLAEGNVSDAVHQFEAYRSLLVAELGVEPSHRLAELLPTQRQRNGAAHLTRR